MFLDWKNVNSQDVERILLLTKSQLSNHNIWIDGGIAFDNVKSPVDSMSDKAYYFSLMGAIEKNSRTIYVSPLCDFVDSATREFLAELSDYKVWKENMSYDDEISLLRLAIEEIKKYA